MTTPTLQETVRKARIGHRTWVAYRADYMSEWTINRMTDIAAEKAVACVVAGGIGVVIAANSGMVIGLDTSWAGKPGAAQRIASVKY